MYYIDFVAELTYVPRYDHVHLWKHVDRVLEQWRRQDSHSPRVYAIRNWLEQAPRPENRITLGESHDAFGLPRLRMCWTLGDLEKRTVACAHELLAEALRDNGVGSLFSDLPSLENRWPDELAFSSHTMGTTRMSASPRNGVVDSDCRVHGVNNLYVAGGSVLSTTGANMVTFNLLVLALRLSDHLKGKLLQYK